MRPGVIKVVIVTYNSAAEIRGCIEALPGSSDKYALEITVVDNGSQDGTLREVARLDHPVHVIPSTNMGYAHGCNLAIREALQGGKEYGAILILNPDLVLPVGAVDRLAEALFSAPDIGGVSPHAMEETGNENHRHKTLFGAPMNEECMDGRGVVVSDRLHGCCMLLRPEVFRKTGLFDEQYFLYWEELDFGGRAIADGFKLLLCYDILVYHRCDTEERTHRIFYMWRNQFLFARKRYPAFVRLMFLLRRALSSLRELLGFMKIKRFDLVRAAMAGLSAGLRGETGKSSNPYASPVSLAVSGLHRSGNAPAD